MTMQCPKCHGSDVETTEVEKKETAAKIIMTVVGFGAAATGYFGDLGSVIDNPTVVLVLRVFMMFMGTWIVWEAVTGLPLPFSGIKLIGTPTETHGECNTCGHEWDLKEEG